jgi:hypothetical protein
MDDVDDAKHVNIFNRTSLRNIVLKSSLARVREAKLNFTHLNLDSAVQYIHRKKYISYAGKMEDS